MSEPTKNPFDLLLDQIRQVVREEIAAAASEKLVKLLYSTKEASEIIGIDENWLAAKARAGLVPHRMLGKYRYFSMSDIQSIIDSSYVQGVQSNHDGQGVSADTKTPRVKSIQTRGRVGNNGD